MKKVFFSSADKKINILQRNRVKKLAALIFKHEQIVFEEIRFIFCSDEYLLKINKSYLQHNYFTDVITFTLSEVNDPVVGEIYLSVDRIKENAKIYFKPYQNELLRVMIHACLHLCGHKDSTAVSKNRMRRLEDFYLNQF